MKHYKDLSNQEFFNNNSDPFLIIEAEKQDAKLLFKWVNEKVVRKNSLDSKPVLWHNHLKWFLDKLSNLDSKIFMFKNKDLKIGQIRIDRDDYDFWLIDYSIDKNHRKKGYGLLLVSALIKRFPNKIFKALVKSDNIASKNIFEKLGFTKHEDKNNNTIKYYFNNN